MRGADEAGDNAHAGCNFFDIREVNCSTVGQEEGQNDGDREIHQRLEEVTAAESA
jgi:hypothetical protein